MNLKDVSYAFVHRYKKQAEREHVSVSNTKNTRWFAAFVDEEMVGFGAFILVGKVARVKGIYIFPEERGLGHGGRMTEAIFEEALNSGVGRLEAFALNPSFYEQRGWRRTATQLRSGAWKVVSQ